MRETRQTGHLRKDAKLRRPQPCPFLLVEQGQWANVKIPLADGRPPTVDGATGARMGSGLLVDEVLSQVETLLPWSCTQIWPTERGSWAMQQFIQSFTEYLQSVSCRPSTVLHSGC